MKALLTFEYKKIFRQNRWTMLTLLGVTLLFLISGTISLNNLDSSATRALLQFTAFSVIGLAAVLTFTLFAPVINAIQNYHRDLNDQHAVFETYIPENGWKRLAAKYITYYTQIQAGVLLVELAFSLVISILITFTRFSPQPLDMGEFPRMIEMVQFMWGKDPVFSILSLLYYTVTLALSLTSATLFINFFITLHSVLRHRLKAATPLTFLAGAITSIFLGWLNEMWFSNAGSIKYQIVSFGPEAIFNFGVSAIAFYAIGYMLEHKTELK
jgi:hypothetical protein